MKVFIKEQIQALKDRAAEHERLASNLREKACSLEKSIERSQAQEKIRSLARF